MTHLRDLPYRLGQWVDSLLLGPDPMIVRQPASPVHGLADPSSRATSTRPVTARRGSLSPAPVARPSLAELMAFYARGEA